MGPLSQTGMTTFMVLLSIVMVIAQMFLGEVPAWMLLSNWALTGGASYVLWDSVDRYRLGRSVTRGMVIVPWMLMAAMANLCCASFSVRFLTAENYAAVFGFLVFVRVSMSLWQEDEVAVRLLVWQGIMMGAVSVIFPGTLLWLALAPAQLFFMRCGGARSILGVISGTLMGVWLSFCLLYFWGPEGALADWWLRFKDLLLVEWDLSLNSIWQWVSVGLVMGMTVLYCIVALMMNSSNTLRAQSINFLLCVCQIMVLLFTLLDMEHLPVYMLLQTMLLGLQLMVILANSRGYLAEWWTLFIVLFYMALSMAPYVPQELLGIKG